MQMQGCFSMNTKMAMQKGQLVTRDMRILHHGRLDCDSKWQLLILIVYGGKV